MFKKLRSFKLYTLFLSIALSVLDWIKRKCQMPRQSVIVTDADITFKNGISLDKTHSFTSDDRFPFPFDKR